MIHLSQWVQMVLGFQEKNICQHKMLSNSTKKVHKDIKKKTFCKYTRFYIFKILTRELFPFDGGRRDPFHEKFNEYNILKKFHIQHKICEFVKTILKFFVLSIVLAKVVREITPI